MITEAITGGLKTPCYTVFGSRNIFEVLLFLFVAGLPDCDLRNKFCERTFAKELLRKVF